MMSLHALLVPLLPLFLRFSSAKVLGLSPTLQTTSLALGPNATSPGTTGFTGHNFSSLNASAVSALNPRWNTNLEGEWHRLLRTPKWREATPYFVMAEPADGIGRSDIDKFTKITFLLTLNPRGREGDSVSVKSNPISWGQWLEPQMKVVIADRPAWEITNLKVSLEEANRVLGLAGIYGPWRSILISTLKGGKDPYYGPGQMYYVFRGIELDHLVGGIDRIVVRGYSFHDTDITGMVSTT